MRTSDIPEGFNQWTIPWTEPEGPELDALCAGTLELPEFELDVEAGEGLPV
ncbi:MAG: hypothetical protein QNI91_17230 [Arenicellales bacterium]|nr:hypothetical protein [Arenicellales bacterium]